VLRVKEAASMLKSHKHSFIIFDELFRGTNVKDALDGSLLVIKGLIKWPSSVFILSSHLLELSKEISNINGFQFAYFESDVIDNKPIFSYKLNEGVSNERLGLLILENEGVNELLEPIVKPVTSK
jgi:DNA mismatch repair ATPase MutS